MRILNLIQCTNLGGMEQASLRLMRALQARGHEVGIVSLNPLAGLRPLLEDAGIPSLGLDYRQSRLTAWFELKKALAAQRAEALIMTGHNFAASLALGGICEGRRLLAIHFHHEGVMPAWRWRLIYRAAMARFQTVTFPSDYVRQEAEAIHPPIARIAMTVRNPLELPLEATHSARRAFRDQIGVPYDVPLIGNAGWLIERKRFDIFLRAAAEILKRRPEAHFVIAGDGELRGALEQLALTLGVAPRIRWTGWLRDLTAFYSGIDLLLFNSDFDAFPTTPMEAMSHGLPVVASIGRGGLGEVLDDGCGWLIRGHDLQALAMAADSALSPEGGVRGGRGRRRTADICDPARIADQIEARLLGRTVARAA
jgi:glycosyltransferase involved in cell wall biosynthesis